jgi:hypothetical protein
VGTRGEHRHLVAALTVELGRHHAALGLDADEAQRHVSDAQADVEAGLERARRLGDAVAVEPVVGGGEEAAEVTTDLEDVLLLEPGRLRLARVGGVREPRNSHRDRGDHRADEGQDGEQASQHAVSGRGWPRSTANAAKRRAPAQRSRDIVMLTSPVRAGPWLRS